MITRILAATALIAVAAAAIWLHGAILTAVLFLVAVVCEYEIIKTINNGNAKVIAPVAYAFTVLLLPASYYGFHWITVLFALMVMTAFAAAILSKKYDLDSIVHTVFAMCYPQMLFVFMYMIVHISDVALSRFLIIFGLACPVFTDTIALFTGISIGKHKLCPDISPKKTVEGAIGGLVGGILATVAITAIFGMTAKMNLFIVGLFGAVISAFSQIGDLSASMVKRKYGVKDYGNIIPGHGGFMDRLDSILFTFPLVYVLYLVVF